MPYSTRILTRACVIALMSMLPLALLASPPASAQISIGVSVNIAPPVLPVYVQPALPAPGYIWTPGYWAWDPDAGDYFWVPGAWVQPPQVGVLWTPGYWGWTNGAYVFNGGYWGPTIGFYGGVNYGFGYTGSGFFGGQWQNGQYYYNSSVSNVTNVNVTNVYSKQVIVNNTTNVSYNGGTGGTTAKPTAEELAAAKEQHIPPTAEQVKHVESAKATPAFRLSNNHGKPAIAAVSKPLTSPGLPKEGGAKANEEKTKEKAEPKNEGVEPKKEVVEPKKEVAEPKKEVAEPKKEIAEPKKELEVPKKELAAPKKEPVAPKKEMVQVKKPVVHPAPHPVAHPAPHLHPAPKAAPCKGEHCPKG